MVIDALERLPEPFRANLRSVAIVIEDEATLTAFSMYCDMEA